MIHYYIYASNIVFLTFLAAVDVTSKHKTSAYHHINVIQMSFLSNVGWMLRDPPPPPPPCFAKTLKIKVIFRGKYTTNI